MLNNITIGQYFPGDTKVHNLDPRVKIFSVFLFLMSLFFINNIYVFIIPFAIQILIINMSKIPLSYILSGLKPIRFIIIFTFFINVFMIKGEIVFRIWRFAIAKEGIYQATFVSIRLILLIIMTTLLTLTTTPISLTNGIEKILKPFKKIGIPGHEIAMMITIALRFIPTLIEEANKIIKAQMARGADFESGNLIARAKNMLPLLIPLFINSYRRADELAMAMEARCYRGDINRTSMKEMIYSKGDFIAIGILVIYFTIILVLRNIL